jgi:hypothetical protein
VLLAYVEVHELHDRKLILAFILKLFGGCYSLHYKNPIGFFPLDSVPVIFKLLMKTFALFL